MPKSFISATERALIVSCAQSSVEIACLEGAPRFRFTPSAFEKPLEHRPPSKRTLAFKRKPHMKSIKNWRPVSLTWGPDDYRQAMKGDPPELTEAREAWADGDPEPLRAWLAANKGTWAAAHNRGSKRVTSNEFKAIRNRAGLTQTQLARLLRISDKRTIRYWESGEREISGPVSLLMEMLELGQLHFISDR